MVPTMSILLIRHGETGSNAARIVQTPDVPLSARGIAQAERLAQRLAGEGVAAILCSDLRRAVMTAERVQAATGAPLRLDAGLQERNYGDIRGRTYASLGVDILAPEYEPPGGERWVDFHARVDATWERIIATAAATDGNLAVITHGLVCYSLALRHLQLPHDQGVAGGWNNASLTIVEARAPWAVRVLNCTSHLDDAASSDAAKV
jgi:2,3-bisphosphoglycerate-dependent phosphoglycerate mutase